MRRARPHAPAGCAVAGVLCASAGAGAAKADELKPRLRACKAALRAAAGLQLVARAWVVGSIDTAISNRAKAQLNLIPIWQAWKAAMLRSMAYPKLFKMRWCVGGWDQNGSRTFPPHTMCVSSCVHCVTTIHRNTVLRDAPGATFIAYARPLPPLRGRNCSQQPPRGMRKAKQHAQPPDCEMNVSRRFRQQGRRARG